MCYRIFVIKHHPEISRRILYERARDCLKARSHLSMLYVDCSLAWYPGLSQSCEKVHYNIYWSNLDYIGQHSQPRMRKNTLFSDLACVFLILIKPCYEVHVENELHWYLPLDQKPIRAIRMCSSYWKVPSSCCENLIVSYLPAFDSGDAH